MSGAPATIKIEGVREFQRALKDVDAGLPKMLRLVFNEAGGIIVDYAQAHIEVKSGRAKASIKARSSQRTGQVSIGGNRAPYVPWLDFGGEGRVRGRPGPRPFIKEGRYVYRGLRLHSDDITAVMTKGLADLAASAKLEVT
jgi:hypothetical protein